MTDPTSTEPLDALVKRVAVPQTPPAAFALFTERIAEWWPLATHSVGRDRATGVLIEPHTGGRIMESIDGGTTAEWGVVTAWEPGRRLAFTWHPGGPAEDATDVTVTFTATDDGTTVELVHRGWTNRPDGSDARESYDTGWDGVLGLFAACAAKAQ